jgi:hypothetical protein
VLLDNSTIGLNGSVTRDGCPFTRVGDEANVDGCMLLEVVGLARLGVCVEEEVEAVALLQVVRSAPINRTEMIAYLCGQSHRS